MHILSPGIDLVIEGHVMMNGPGWRTPADAVICVAETSISTKSIINHLNTPFIHMNYSKDPYGSNKSEARRVCT